MVLKVSLLNLGLLAMVVLISSEGEARILAETKETKAVGSRCAESSDCFNIPGWPSIGGIPGYGGIPGIGGIPSFGGIPGIGGNPLIPGGPKAKFVKENDNIGELKDDKKTNVVGRCAEGTDCFNIPGWNGGIPGIGGIPGFGGIPGIVVIPGIGGNPLIPSGPKHK